LPRAFTYRLFNTLIALVWLVNGLLCKILHLVPRHERIVERILGDEYSKSLTLLIGLSEVVMAIWILSRWKPKVNAILQMTIVATMNVLEFVLAPDLLLWGPFNALFAFLFIVFVYYNEFILRKKTVLLNKK
jgi:DoxX-like family